jgi:arsenate reductase
MALPTKVLILCTGNSARSQMAEGVLRSLDLNLEVHSAGTLPASQVHPSAIQVMNEIGIDISSSRPKPVSQFLKHSFDYVITVCDHADQNCPAFTGPVKDRLHLGFSDPAKAKGDREEVLAAFRNVRDQIRTRFSEFYEKHLRSSQGF